MRIVQVGHHHLGRLAADTRNGSQQLHARIGSEAAEDTARIAPTAYPDGLSEREVEVLRLLAAGKSNPEIADALVISVNTVIRHVANIFDKTGAANRAQATAYAKDHGIA